VEDSGRCEPHGKRQRTLAVRKTAGVPWYRRWQVESPTRISYALLLVPLSSPNNAYRFLVFTPNNEAQSGLTVVESSDGPGAANGFVRTVALTKVFSADWRRKLNVAGPEGILFVDAGLDEYEADVYFWSEGKYHHEPIDD